MTTIHYILDANHNVVPTDLHTWASFFGNMANRRVAFTEIAPGITVSTVFLGIDHNFSNQGPPLVFETMGFTDYGESECSRYATWAEAELGHMETVERLQTQLKEAIDQ